MLTASSQVNDTIDAPLHVANVKVHGAAHTSEAFLGWLIRPHLSSAPPDLADPSAQSTLGSVLHTTRAVSDSLSATDLFRTLSARIERSADGPPGDVDIIFNVTEKGRFFIKTATEIGNSEGTAVSSLFLRCFTCSPPHPSPSLRAFQTSSAARTLSPLTHLSGQRLNALLTRPFHSRSYHPLLLLLLFPSLERIVSLVYKEVMVARNVLQSKLV